jgi:HD-GYP domain-containing protein (c-di-GMP phosphodiesterase class II)
MEGLKFSRCARCGRAPAGERLVHERCMRCRALELVDGFDDGLAGHARRVTMVAVLVAHELGVDDAVRRDVELGGLLHDLGKLTIPASILSKAGPLDEAEQLVMRTHAAEGARLAAGLEALPTSVPVIVRASHERWDGDGYPDGLRGEEIPLAARIVSCADAFDAMTSSRSYRPALEIRLALDIVCHEAGRQFDPAVAEALVTAVSRWELELSAEAMSTAFDLTLRRLRREQQRAPQQA